MDESKMNYIKQFAEMLGVEIGEEFNLIDRYGNLFKDSPYKLTKNGFVDREGYSTFTLSGHVISGNCTIQKLPWKPEYGEEVWHISAKGSIFHDRFDKNSCVDLALYAIGNCFETKEEAEKNKDKIMKMQKEIKEELE